jgi:hypothetical protein
LVTNRHTKAVRFEPLFYYAEYAEDWLEIGLQKSFDSAFLTYAKDFWLKKYAASAMMISDKGYTLWKGV